MPTILTAHQPLYIPWLGFFHKLSMSDIFCLWDDVQFSPNDYIHRNRIKNPNGPTLITIPIHSKGHREKVILDMEIDNNHNWQRIHWNSISVSYDRKAPYFESYNDFFKAAYKKKWEKLVDIDEYFLNYLIKEIGISIDIVKASDMNFEGEKSDRVLDMCLKLGADAYIFGEQGKGYANIESFREKSIALYFQKYKHPVYPQLYGEFASHLSVIDLLFCYGEKSYDIITKNNPKREDLLKKLNL